MTAQKLTIGSSEVNNRVTIAVGKDVARSFGGVPLEFVISVGFKGKTVKRTF